MLILELICFSSQKKEKKKNIERKSNTVIVQALF